MAASGAPGPQPSLDDLAMQFEAYVKSLVPADFVGIERAPLDVDRVIAEERSRRERIRHKQAEREAAKNGDAPNGSSSGKQLQMSESLKRKIGGGSGKQQSATSSTRARLSDSDSDEEVSKASMVKRPRTMKDPLAGNGKKKNKKLKTQGVPGLQKPVELAKEDSDSADEEDEDQITQHTAADALAQPDTLAQPPNPAVVPSPKKPPTTMPSATNPPSTPPRASAAAPRSPASAPATPSTPGGPDLSGLTKAQRRAIKNKRKNEKKKLKKKLQASQE